MSHRRTRIAKFLSSTLFPSSQNGPSLHGLITGSTKCGRRAINNMCCLCAGRVEHLGNLAIGKHGSGEVTKMICSYEGQVMTS